VTAKLPTETKNRQGRVRINGDRWLNVSLTFMSGRYDFLANGSAVPARQMISILTLLRKSLPTTELH